MKIINVVCGISINDNGIFLARLNTTKRNAGLWEFPGGKTHELETHQEALVREFFEELNIDIQVNEYFMKSEIIIDKKQIVLHSYFVDFKTEPKSSIDHDLLGRFNKAELSNLKLSKADISFVDQIIKNKLIN
ncbi:(deoxy)nucleoside triphosphate pyrophosphohydrolase [Flavobacterium cerinum]|uniref:8-oxo-dGTP diphosphatase n=1 Tax=Flavobacterium cerinum TaxID=2502784 RepID=A0ABY5IRT1_9FLAO|nr:NUDIX domain-containing protein [Flavobacterium cerinum]UUC45553.1 NUDIX domain-containing protein [Flavobacterium cerinum]